MGKNKISGRDSGASLKRELGLPAVFSIAAGAMISSGLFVLPGIAFKEVGPAVVLSYVLAAIFMIPTILSKAELSTALPKSGGSYFYIERSLGPFAGTVAGFANWLSIALKSAFALIGIGALSTVMFPDIGMVGIKAVAIGSCFLFALLNALSLKGTGKVQIIFVFILLIIITLYGIAGLPSVDVMHYTPFITSDFQSLFAVTGMVFVSYGGLTKVVSVAEEVRDPSRNLPLGILLSFGIVSVLYILVVSVTVGVVDGRTLSGSLVPLSLGAEAALGLWGEILIDIAAFLAFATTANAGILSASRSPMAMSRDGLLPGFFARTSGWFGTPHIAITVTALLMITAIVSLSIEDLVKTGSTMMILLFILVNISLIIMRYSGLQNYRPTFKAPLFPWLQIAAIIIYGFLIVEMGRIPLLFSGVFVPAASLWYIAYVNRRIDRESAFVYMVKSVISKDIIRGELEDELKQIIIERDRITLDKFDFLVKQAVIIDSDEHLSAQDMFRKVAHALSPRLTIPEDKLYKMFLKREMESSTVVHPGLAIPHIILDGNHIFDLLLVRCNKGILFSELHPPVTTMFVLVGSRDERNFHLRALMTIAHIVKEPEFQTKWSKAKNSEELRDILLLSSRQRQK